MPKAFLISRKQSGLCTRDGLLQEPLIKTVHMAQSVNENINTATYFSGDMKLFRHEFKPLLSPTLSLSEGATLPVAPRNNNVRLPLGYPFLPVMASNKIAEASCNLLCSENNSVYKYLNYQVGPGRHSNHEIPNTAGFVKRALSFSGKSRSASIPESQSNVGIDINNNNKNDVDDVVSDEKLFFSEKPDPPKGVHQMSSLAALKDLKEETGSHPSLMDSNALRLAPSCYTSSGKSDSEDTDNCPFFVNPKTHPQIFLRHGNSNRNRPNITTMHNPQTENNHNSWIKQPQGISSERVPKASSSSLVHSKSADVVCQSGQATAGQLSICSPGENRKSTSPTTPQHNSKRHKETTTCSSATPEGDRPNLSPIVRSRLMASTCSTSSQDVLITKDRGHAGARRETTPEESAILPISPNSPSSSSSSPSSVRSSSVLKPEPWNSQMDLLTSPAPAASSSFTSSSTSHSTSSSSSSSKYQSPVSARKFIFWDSSEPEVLKIPCSCSHVENCREGRIENEHLKTTSQSLSIRTERCEHKTMSTKDSKYGHAESPAKHTKTIGQNSPVLPKRSSTDLHLPEGISESKQRKIRDPRKSFTIDSIMSRDSPNSVNKKTQDNPFRKNASTELTPDQCMPQDESDLQDESHVIHISPEHLEISTSSEHRKTSISSEHQESSISSEHRETPQLTEEKEVQQIRVNVDKAIAGPSHRPASYHRPLINKRSSTLANKSQNNNQSQLPNVIPDNLNHQSHTSKNNLLRKESASDTVFELPDISKSSSTLSSSSSPSTIPKLHRPLPLLPRPTPVFPSFLPYSSIPADIYPPSPFLAPIFRSDIHGHSAISDLTINSDAQFVSNVLPFLNNNPCHKSTIEPQTLNQLQSIQLIRQSNKDPYVNNIHNGNTTCFDSRKDGHVYSRDNIYLTLEHMKYSNGIRPPGSELHALQDTGLGLVKTFPEQSREQMSSGLCTNPKPVNSSYLNHPSNLNKTTPAADPRSTGHARSRSRQGSVDDCDDESHSPDGVISPLKALGVSGGKSFKGFLETANVKVEFINKGHGIKNPLLNAEFGESKLDILSHAGTVPCPVCHVSFQSSRELQRHLKGHKEIKRFLCTFCGKGFNDTFDLKRHTRTHTGVRPYKCRQCDKAFTQRCSLESHCRKIHGVSPHLAFNQRRTKLYVCEDCGHSTPTADEHFAHLRHTHAHSIDDKELTSS